MGSLQVAAGGYGSWHLADGGTQGFSLIGRDPRGSDFLTGRSGSRGSEDSHMSVGTPGDSRALTGGAPFVHRLCGESICARFEKVSCAALPFLWSDFSLQCSLCADSPLLSPSWPAACKPYTTRYCQHSCCVFQSNQDDCLRFLRQVFQVFPK